MTASSPAVPEREAIFNEFADFVLVHNNGRPIDSVIAKLFIRQYRVALVAGQASTEGARSAEAGGEAHSYSLDADPQGIRERVASAITGALAFGAQGNSPPPDGHWLAPFWEMARAERESEQDFTECECGYGCPPGCGCRHSGEAAPAAGELLRAAKEALHHMCKAGCSGVDELDEAITDYQHALASTPTSTSAPEVAAPAGEPVISVSALSRMFEELSGLDRNQPGYSYKAGWNDALRRAMDYASPAPTTEPPAAQAGRRVPMSEWPEKAWQEHEAYERARFEAALGTGRDLGRSEDGTYLNHFTRHDFDIWQACAALASTQTPTPAAASEPRAPVLTDAERVLGAMESGRWSVERCDPAPFLTDEYNAANAWIVRRKQAPYCDASGTRQWSGATAIEALSKGIAALAAASTATGGAK